MSLVPYVLHEAIGKGIQTHNNDLKQDNLLNKQLN